MNVLFKCGKSKYIGSGHYYRCLALADEFRKHNHNCFFLGLKKGILLKKKIKKKDQIKDLNFTKEFIKKKNIQIIIKDIYCLGYDWEKKISKESTLVVIEDSKKIKHYCDIYINYHLNLFKNENKKYLLKKSCLKLLGLKYAIIRNLKISKEFKFKQKTVFVYMGSSDKNMYIKKLVKFFKNKKLDKIHKIFLLNKNHLKESYLIKNLKKIANTKIILEKTKNFHNYIISSDLNILPAGLTMLEQMSLNSNSLIISQNKTQEKIASNLKKANLINYIKNIEKLNENKFIKYLDLKKNKNKEVNLIGKNLIYKKVLDYFKKLS